MNSVAGNTAASKDALTTFFGQIASRSGPLLGAVLSIPSIRSAQIVDESDSDFVMIDMEHSPMASEIVTNMVHTYMAASRSRPALVILFNRFN